MIIHLIEKKIKFLLIALGITMTISFLSWSGVVSFADTDGDGIIDSLDNCPNITNSFQYDLNGDNTGNGCDIEDDNYNKIKITNTFEPITFR